MRTTTEPVYESPDKWLNLKSFGLTGTGDEGTKLQAAFDSGAKTIFFPGGFRPLTNQDLKVCGAVERIIGLQGIMNYGVAGKSLEIADYGPSDAPTVVIDMMGYDLSRPSYTIKINTKRNVVIKHASLGRIVASGSGKLFLEDVAINKLTINSSDQKVWARQLNIEGAPLSSTNPNTAYEIENLGGTLWILGMKTESMATMIKTTNGGRTELLGAMPFVNGSYYDSPMFLVEDAEASFAGVGEYASNSTIHFTPIVSERQCGIEQKLYNSSSPLVGVKKITTGRALNSTAFGLYRATRQQCDNTKISGQAFIDSNNNGIKDNNENWADGAAVTITDGFKTYNLTTNSQGEYLTDALVGNYQIQITKDLLTSKKEILNVNKGQSTIVSAIAITNPNSCINNPISCTTLSLKLNLEGAYSPSLGKMTNYLRANQLLPDAQPFSGLPWNCTNGDTIDNVNNLTSTEQIVDWVLVEIRDANNNLILKQAALLQNDGQVIDSKFINQATGIGGANATNSSVGLDLGGSFSSGNYKIIVKHRNHIAISTLNPITITSGVTSTLDFTTQTGYNNTKGQNKIILNPDQALLGELPVYGLKVGDANSDGFLDATDRTLIRSMSEGAGFYISLDLNMDGGIDAADRTISRLVKETAENIY